MKKEQLDFEIFYQADPNIGVVCNGIDIGFPFEFELGLQTQHLEEFFKTSSTQDVIWVWLKLFKDRYPNSFTFPQWFGKREKQTKKSGTNYVYESVDIYRNDIKKVVWAYQLIEYYDEKLRGNRNGVFLSELDIEFNCSLEIDFVLNALKEKKIRIERTGSGRMVLVDDSPISKVVISSNSFKMTTNPDKYKNYM